METDLSNVAPFQRVFDVQIHESLAVATIATNDIIDDSKIIQSEVNFCDGLLKKPKCFQSIGLLLSIKISLNSANALKCTLLIALYGKSLYKFF